MKRKALITGTSRGIGEDISKYLLKKDYFVYGLSRSNSKINSKEYKHFNVNITKSLQINNFFNKFEDESKVIDSLILNTGGVSTFGNNDQLNIEDWEMSFNLNLFSSVRIIKKAIPLLKNSKSPSIIFIGSAVSTMPGYGNPHYASAKSALLTYAKHLSLIYSSSNIKVNTISPGPVLNDAFKDNMRNFSGKEDSKLTSNDFINKELNKIPLSRFTESSEISSLVYFLDSDKNKSITGQNILIDGGKNRHL